MQEKRLALGTTFNIVFGPYAAQGSSCRLSEALESTAVLAGATLCCEWAATQPLYFSG
ncbi:hypothetical protein YSA_01168 [Pseudomonas putida ND6]|uniref:Uncharacterized protein n=1 Tax=Pseudomonas putida ND6 TaxID=231023 RepID=I3UPJ3_PSEPU|nr:hypothetical protein YSA_01168 [Pseudomonas putida ND6]